MSSKFSSEFDICGFNFGKTMIIPMIIALPIWSIVGLFWLVSQLGKAIFSTITRR